MTAGLGTWTLGGLPYAAPSRSRLVARCDTLAWKIQNKKLVARAAVMGCITSTRNRRCAKPGRRILSIVLTRHVFNSLPGTPAVGAVELWGRGKNEAYSRKRFWLPRS
jgi:hypothetical protein